MIGLILIGLSSGGGEGPGTVSRRLDALARTYWEALLEAEPVEATALGDRRFDHRLPDLSPEGIARRRAGRQELLARARALPEAELSASDRITRRALVLQLESDLARIDCGLEEWVVDPLRGPQVEFFNIESVQPIRNPAEARAMVGRWNEMGPYLDQEIANLRRGLGSGKVAVGEIVEKVIEQLRAELARPPEESALLAPIRAEHPDWKPEDVEAFRQGMRRAVIESIRPAWKRYLAFLEREVRPAARSAERPGLGHLPGGSDCYRNLIRVYTSLDPGAEEIHRTGVEEAARIMDEIVRLGAKRFGTTDRAEILARLRTDPELHFRTRKEVAAAAESALARANRAVPDWFGIRPQAGCEVVPMGPHEEAHSTIAYYRQPATDGSRPGRYYINTLAPETRPRYQAEALAYHEAVPGHHLQIAIAQELRDLPEFRKHTGVTAFVEGWGLYAERLADEMGLYTSDLDRIGMLSFEAWRAGRLVVDTGMHALGWSRRRAIRFLWENTALERNNIVNEVDRYITWPGQALAYKTGQLEILRLRSEARRRLGDRFDMKSFHDTVLRNGAVSLAQLRELVDEWVASLAPESDGPGDPP